MATVELKGVAKTFAGDVKAVRDVNFRVEDGELLTLLGPSGCGKSTILRLVAGLEEPEEGEILIDGKKINHVSPADRDVAMVFQSYALYPHMTVFNNIAVGLRMRRLPGGEIDSRVKGTSEKLGISELLGRKPKELSGGQRQRVALARAMVRDPKVFLLDEPLSNLDAALRDRTRTELKRLFSGLNATVIYVTHDQVEAMTLSDRIVVLKDGAVQQIGTPDEIYGSPVNTFVATFVGSPKMNLIEGEIKDKKICFFDFAFDVEELISQMPEGKVTVGIRPEDISISTAGSESENTARVVLVEPMGQYSVVTLDANGLELTAITMSPIGQAGKSVSIEINISKIHLFDSTSGNRIHK